MEITVRITKTKKTSGAVFTAGREVITDSDIEAEVVRSYLDQHDIDPDTDDWEYEATIDEIKIT